MRSTEPRSGNYESPLPARSTNAEWPTRAAVAPARSSWCVKLEQDAGEQCRDGPDEEGEVGRVWRRAGRKEQNLGEEESGE